MKAVLLAVSCCLIGMTSSQTIGKRNDDTNPLTPVVQQQSQDIADLKARLTALEARLKIAERGVAFFAQFSAGQVTAPGSSPYQMDTVILNDGNGYDPTLGVFTAPVSGVYIFTFQAFTDAGQPQRPLLDIFVNGITKARMAFDVDQAAQANGFDSDSTSLTVKLQQGNKVWTAASGKTSYKFWGEFHTFFSGALLYSV